MCWPKAIHAQPTHQRATGLGQTEGKPPNQRTLVQDKRSALHRKRVTAFAILLKLTVYEQAEDATGLVPAGLDCSIR